MLSTAEARPRRLRDARAAMYVELILNASTRVFASEGYEATKVQQIAKEAGISLGTLYEVFPSKFDIWRAIHERHLAALFENALAAIAAGEGNLADQLLLGLEAYIGYLVSQPDYLRLHLMDGATWALGTGLRSKVQLEAWERGKQMMSDLLARGIDEGILVPQDPDLAAQIMIGMHQVMLAHWIKRGMVSAPAEIIAQIQEHTIRAFFVTSLVNKALARFRKSKRQPPRAAPGAPRRGTT